MATNRPTPGTRERCKYFMHGVCRFGQNCFNSHDRDSKPSTICKYYLLGSCSYGDQCFYDHVRPKSNNSSSSGSPSSNSQTSRDEDNSRLVTRVLNKPKLQLTLADESGNDSVVNKNEFSPNSYYEALTGAQQPSVNEQNYEDLSYFDADFIDYLKNKKDRNEATQHKVLCPIYEKSLNCPYGEGCQFVHGNVCDICNMASLNPYDEAECEQHKAACMQLIEKDMEEAFAVQRSLDKICGICMEVVWEKEREQDKRFGLLENCNHIFCLGCIRKWRASKSYENKIVKACPECRVKSDFVTPTQFWFEDDDNKKKIIQEYKVKLG